MGGFTHQPVLLREVVQTLDPQPAGVYVDCTAGLGGHGAEIARHLGPRGAVVLFDLDAGNLAAAAERIRALPEAPAVHTEHGSFSRAPFALARLGLVADMVLADLGFASSQMDDPARGLSFLRDGPLDMRLNPEAAFTAAELVNTLPERELADLLRKFGEEQAAGKIAAKLVRARTEAPISTTGRLAALVREVIPRRPGQSIDPATRTFQALRIAVNDEIGSLERLLEGVARGAIKPESWLAHGARGARVAIISFHSLEDRPVKRVFGELAARGVAESLCRKPVTASEEEVGTNPRSRSAKMRAIRVIGPGRGSEVFSPRAA